MIDIHPAVTIIMSVAAVVTAVGVIWRQAIRPVIRAAARAEEALPVLMAAVPLLGQVLAEFTPSAQPDGLTIRDRIVAAHETGVEAQQAVTDLTQKVEVLEQYVHGFKHAWTQEVTVLTLAKDTLTQQVVALNKHLVTLQVWLEANDLSIPGFSEGPESPPLSPPSPEGEHQP